MKNLTKRSILPSLLFASTLLPFSESYAQSPSNEEQNKTPEKTMTVGESMRFELETGLKIEIEGKLRVKRGAISKKKSRPGLFCDFDSYKGNVPLQERVIKDVATFYVIPAVRKKAEEIWETAHSKPHFFEVTGPGIKPTKIEDPYTALIKKEYGGLNQTKEEFVRYNTNLENFNSDSLLEVIIRTTQQNEADIDYKLNLTEAQRAERGYAKAMASGGREYLKLALAIQEENSKNNVTDETDPKTRGKLTRIQNYFNIRLVKTKGTAPFNYSVLSEEEIKEISLDFLREYWPDIIKAAEDAASK